MVGLFLLRLNLPSLLCKLKQCTLLVGHTPALRSLALRAAVIKVGVARRAGSFTLPTVLSTAPLGFFYQGFLHLG
jgi:hypothetical protein